MTLAEGIVVLLLVVVLGSIVWELDATRRHVADLAGRVDTLEHALIRTRPR